MPSGQEDYEKTRSLFEQSVTILREVGDKWQLLHPLGDLAWMVWQQGDTAQARAMSEENLAAFRELGGRGTLGGIALNLRRLSRVAARQGDYAAARLFGQEALSIENDVGNKSGIAWSMKYLSELAYLQGDLALALSRCEQGLPLARELTDKELESLLLGQMGQVRFQEGDYQQSAALIQESLTLAEQVNFGESIRSSLLSLGSVAQAKGDYEQALARYRESLKRVIAAPELPNVAARLEALAKVAVALGQCERATKLFGAAQNARERMIDPLPPVERTDYERHRDMACSALGEEGFSAAWREGQAMTLEQAIEYVLANEGDERGEQ